ncbi:MAG: hypothetical protein WBV62_09105, partial [Roseobacter sp.]
KALVDSNAAMLEAYRGQDWDAMERALEQVKLDLAAMGLAMDEYVEIYETRLSNLRAEPPGPNWDGVFASTKK